MSVPGQQKERTLGKVSIKHCSLLILDSSFLPSWSKLPRGGQWYQSSNRTRTQPDPSPASQHLWKPRNNQHVTPPEEHYPNKMILLPFTSECHFDPVVPTYQNSSSQGDRGWYSSWTCPCWTGGRRCSPCCASVPSWRPSQHWSGPPGGSVPPCSSVRLGSLNAQSWNVSDRFARACRSRRQAWQASHLVKQIHQSIVSITTQLSTRSRTV